MRESVPRLSDDPTKTHVLNDGNFPCGTTDQITDLHRANPKTAVNLIHNASVIVGSGETLRCVLSFGPVSSFFH